MDLAAFERDAAAFLAQLHREHYLHGAGLKPELEIAPIYERARRLFDPETFHTLRDVPMEEPRGEKYRRFLLDFVAGSYLEYGARAESEAIARAEAAATIVWGEQELSFRTAPIVWANDPDPVRRHDLNQRWRAALAETNTLRAERHRKMQALVPDLEHGDYVQLWDTLRGLRLERLVAQMRALLDTTADLYRDRLREALAEHGLPLDDAWRADLSYVLRGTRFDAGFPRELLLPTLVRTLRDFGFELEEQRNITLDLEFRPTKSPRAFCAPLDVPHDVRLVLQPSGGHQDYETLLHEAGHAEHYGNVDPALPFAYRWLGDAAVTEGYAFLLHYLPTDPLWLRRHLEEFADLEGYRRFALFQKLQLLRRYAAKLLYELELQRADDPEPFADRYAEMLSHYLMVRYFPEEYLADVDDDLYAAQYLRAWIFEAQLRTYLRKEYDEDWFRAPRAGRFIRDLWREGQKYTADELVRFMGYDDLDPAPLLAELTEGLE